MAITFAKEKSLFTLTTKNTKYAFSVDCGKYLLHRYYGKKSGEVGDHGYGIVSFSPYREEDNVFHSPDVLPLELPLFGSGDFRASALKIRGADGSCVTDLSYVSYKKFKGRREIDGIPCAEADGKTETLEIKLADLASRYEVYLYYTVFYDEDVISRYMVVKNCGKDAIKIEKCMPLSLDLNGMDYDLVSFCGRHFAERNLERAPLRHGSQVICSRRGASSHQANPFIMLCKRKATEERGDVFGFNFVYSGSFLDEVEVDQLGNTRVQVGLGEENFGYSLLPGESFESPEAIMTYSSSGMGRLSRNLHDFTRNHILPRESVELPHPVVLNTWEACYFNIDEKKLIDFAEESEKVGIDMLVMDDGWFGKRNDDTAGLGDWFENKEKFPRGLRPFAEAIREKGVKFGIWIEPEMVNPNSDLYRAHPDWALRTPDREPLQSRNQLVLDMSNPDVIEYLKDVFSSTFRGVPIDYFKWDMNRHICDAGSSFLPPERQDEVMFRHIKGVYALLDWFKKEFPDAIIETCSGGGGRYDLAMMKYGFQIWTSDNTYPYVRTWIQASSLMGYPAATMSCHVSNPGEDMKALDFRYKVACGGMLGYEFNILGVSDEFKKVMKRQIADYRTFEHLMRTGDYFSLVSPFENDFSAYYYADKERTQFVFSLIEKEHSKPRLSKPLKIKEAKKDATYIDEFSGKTYSGDELRSGLRFDITGEPNTAMMMFLTEKK